MEISSVTLAFEPAQKQSAVVSKKTLQHNGATKKKGLTDVFNG